MRLVVQLAWLGGFLQTGSKSTGVDLNRPSLSLTGVEVLLLRDVECGGEKYSR